MNNYENLIWITNEWGDMTHEEFERQHAVYFRKLFNAKKDIKQAYLTIFSNGITDIYMNGELVTKDYFAPGPSEYTRAYSFKKYDVSNFIFENNALLVIAGDGWYCGEYTQRRRPEHVYGVKIALTLDITYADGTSETITSDDSWQTFRGAIELNDIYHGEEFDASKPHIEYSLYDFVAEGDKALLTRVPVKEFIEYDIEPVVKISELEPVYLKKSVNGGFLYDFKQNFAGVISFTVKGKKGAKVVLRHGEVLTLDGRDVYMKNLRFAKGTDTYTLKGDGVETYSPRFTYHGFRYAEIKIEGEAEILSVKGLVLHTDLEKTGEFETDNELLNKIYSCSLWGAKSNFVCIPTDCPQRNERFGWLADTQLFTGTGVNMFKADKFYDYYLELVQKGTDFKGKGNVPVFVPICPRIGAAEAVYGWSDAVIIIPYYLYTYFGDKTIINKYVGLMKDYMGFCKKRNPNFIQDANKYGDWLNAGSVTDERIISTAYYANSARLLAYLLGEIGDSESKAYRELFENIRSAYRKEFWNEADTRYKEGFGTQTSYALGVCFELITPEEAREGIYETFLEYDLHAACGFMGANYILPALSLAGHEDLAYKLLMNETYPSWGYCVRNGATTCWEHWDSYSVEKGYKDPEMNSFNHYTFGSCAEWFYTGILGIKPLEPGFKKAQVKPYISTDPRLKKASGYHDTPFGRISVSWCVEGDVADVVIDNPSMIPIDYSFEKIVEIKQDGVVCEKFDEKSVKTCVKIKI